jgi:dTMP kinase
MFITFEGGEGTGKTTLIRNLASKLNNQNYDVIITREPGGSPSGEAIRNLILNYHWEKLSEVLLFNANRIEHLTHVVIPALNDGKIVLCDRFADSTLAYQGYGLGIDLDFLKVLQEKVVIRKQDLTFILDLDPAVGQTRLSQRADINHIDLRSLEFHKKVRQGFLEIAKTNKALYHVVDANETPETVCETVLSVIFNRFKAI